MGKAIIVICYLPIYDIIFIKKCKMKDIVTEGIEHLSGEKNIKRLHLKFFINNSSISNKNIVNPEPYRYNM